MFTSQTVMHESEFRRIQDAVTKLVRLANARVVCVVDVNGQLISAAGDVDQLDTTSLASLTAGSIAATGGIAKLLREQEFATQFHEGKNAQIFMQRLGDRATLVVIFGVESSVGLVKLRVRQTMNELLAVFKTLEEQKHDPATPSPFAEITDEDIDDLFND